MSIDQLDDLLTTTEAARLLKVSPVTITRYLKQGRLRAYHVGPRAIRISRKDLQQFMRPSQARETPVTPEHGQPMLAKPTPEELQRRQALARQILAHRQQADIRPLTTADLVRQAREERTWYGSDR